MTGWALLLPERSDPAIHVPHTRYPVSTVVTDPPAALRLLAGEHVDGLLVLGWWQLHGLIEPAAAPTQTDPPRPQRTGGRRPKISADYQRPERRGLTR